MWKRSRDAEWAGGVEGVLDGSVEGWVGNDDKVGAVVGLGAGGVGAEA